MIINRINKTPVAIKKAAGVLCAVHKIKNNLWEVLWLQSIDVVQLVTI